MDIQADDISRMNWLMQDNLLIKGGEMRIIYSCGVNKGFKILIIFPTMTDTNG